MTPSWADEATAEVIILGHVANTLTARMRHLKLLSRTLFATAYTMGFRPVRLIIVWVGAFCKIAAITR